MAEAGRPKAPLTLTVDERAVLERWARRPKSAQALALRSKIVLACAEGTANKEVAARLGVTPQMVGKWRARFVTARLEGLADEPRPGQPRKITDEQVEEVIVKTLEDKPPDLDTHWSTRSMAKAAGLNQTAVSRIWRASGLKPHVQETWKLSTDPQFIEKVRDVVGLYMDPPEHALVLCVDEKTQIQAIDRTAPCLPILPTTPARRSHDYVRNGTTSLFAALNIATGQVIASHHRQHRHQEFLKFLKTIDAATPAGPPRPAPAPDLHNPPPPKPPRREEVADPPSPVPYSLHPDQLQLAQPRGALVRRAHQPQAAPLSAPQRPRARSRHPGMDPGMERRSPAIRVDQDRRPDPGKHRQLSSAN